MLLEPSATASSRKFSGTKPRHHKTRAPNSLLTFWSSLEQRNEDIWRHNIILYSVSNIITDFCCNEPITGNYKSLSSNCAVKRVHSVRFVLDPLEQLWLIAKNTWCWKREHSHVSRKQFIDPHRKRSHPFLDGASINTKSTKACLVVFVARGTHPHLIRIIRTPRLQWFELLLGYPFSHRKKDQIQEKMPWNHLWQGLLHRTADEAPTRTFHRSHQAVQEKTGRISATRGPQG